MADKAHIWEYFSNDILDDTNESNETHQSKRIKNSEKRTINQDISWIKSLLHPSLEKSFIRVEVSSVIAATKQRIILNIKPNPDLFPEFDSLIGFFDIWWWKSNLCKIEFMTIQQLSNNFKFLERILRNENILTAREQIILLLNSPKLITDDSGGRKGLVTCKRFLIIDC